MQHIRPEEPLVQSLLVCKGQREMRFPLIELNPGENGRRQLLHHQPCELIPRTSTGPRKKPLEHIVLDVVLIKPPQPLQMPNKLLGAT